ncbi:hypothetical protein TEA_013963 [Camellia sinensis var. sinensis]|uniref:Uncharacterized protein n=1 Tax=Camellia sinensis var. sinensis TaxID=542762 RepID=A0A4S4DKP0_CAMSN|nr:hypothetical protein TEA_013963 [Camellia sinensis var. sinensis]
MEVMQSMRSSRKAKFREAMILGHWHDFIEKLIEILYSYVSDLAIFGASMAGACIGFLSHNRYKASVFMGDTGSLALGGALAAMASCTGMFLPLFISSGIFVLEAASVIMQHSAYICVMAHCREWMINPEHGRLVSSVCLAHNACICILVQCVYHFLCVQHVHLGRFLSADGSLSPFQQLQLAGCNSTSSGTFHDLVSKLKMHGHLSEGSVWVSDTCRTWTRTRTRIGHVMDMCPILCGRYPSSRPPNAFTELATAYSGWHHFTTTLSYVESKNQLLLQAHTFFLAWVYRLGLLDEVSDKERVMRRRWRVNGGVELKAGFVVQ